MSGRAGFGTTFGLTYPGVYGTTIGRICHGDAASGAASGSPPAGPDTYAALNRVISVASVFR